MRLKTLIGAEGRTRTGTAFATTPSRWRVYQFHHVRCMHLHYLTNEIKKN